MIGMLFFRFGGQAITFLIIALLARNLGPEQFGIYSTLTIFISFCAILLTPSLNDLLIREAIRKPSHILTDNFIHSEALNNGYGLRITLAIVGFLIAISVGPLMGWEGMNIGLFALAAVSLFTSLAMPSVRTAYDVPLQLDYRMDSAAAINFAGRTLLLFAFLASFSFSANLTGIVTAQVIGETLAFALLLVMLARAKYSIKPAFDFGSLKTIALLAAPLVLAETFTVIYTRLDVLLLNQFIGAREAGIFAGPLRIIDGLQIIPTVILGSLIPLLNRLKQENNASFLRAIKLSARAFWICGIICAICLSPFSDDITRLFLGNEFSDSSPILKIGVFCAPLIFVGTLLPAILIINGEPKLIATIYFLLAIISVGINLILIPKYGATGAIYSKLITYASIYPLMLFWQKSRSLSWSFLSQGALPFVLSIFLTYYLLKLNLPLIWGLPAILLCCLSLIWFSGWFGKSILLEMKTLFTRGTSTELY